MGRKPSRSPEEESKGTFGFNTVFDAFFSSPRPMFSLSTRLWNPPADVYETLEDLVVKVEVAGMTAEDFDISIKNNCLVVRGCRHDNDHSLQIHVHNVEVRYGGFERAFALPSGMNVDEVHAAYDRGFLTVRLPKRFQPPRQITIPVETD
jgi:HSP20 family protein